MTPPLSPDRETRRAGIPPWMPLLLVAVAWAAQGGSLANGWVWDDAILIRDGDPVAKGLAALPDAWASPWGGEEQAVGLYRPLVTASLALQAAVHGVADPFPFHLANLFLHGLASVLLLALANRLLPRRPIVTAGAALLFAAHPMHAGTVSWIVARGDLLAAVFGLSAALVWTRPKGNPVVTVAWTAVLSFAAVLSKESAAVLLPVLFLLDVGCRDGSVASALRRRWPGYAALLLPLAAWFLMRSQVVGGLGATAQNAVLSGRDRGTAVMIGAGALVRTLGNLLVPAGLCGDGSADPVLSRTADVPFAYVASALVLLAVVVVLAVRLLAGKRSVPEAALGLAILLYLPALQIVPIGAVFEDRFAYLPSLAFLLLPAWVAERLFRSRARVLPAAAAAAVLLGFGAGSWAAAADWRDEDAFDRALLAQDPRHVKALVRLGRDLRERGTALRRRGEESPSTPETRPAIEAIHRRANALLTESVRLLERARSLPQGRKVSVLRTLANSYLALPDARAEVAEETIAELLALKRFRVGGRTLSWEQVAEEDLRSAASRADRALMAEVLSQRARAAAYVGDATASARWWTEAADWAGGDAAMRRQAGIAWLAAVPSRPDLAVPQLEAALALVGVRGERRTQIEADLAGAKAAVGRKAQDLLDQARLAAKDADGFAKAVEACDEAVRLRPDFVAPRVLKAQTQKRMGNLSGARDTALEAKDVLSKRAAGSTGEKDAALLAETDALLKAIEDERR